MADPLFFHVDMDAFYASVEQLDFPQLRGKPVIVGGNSTRGVVSACSYEARAFGVHSAMPMYQARKLCPQGHIMPVRMQRYAEMSEYIMELFSQFSPVVQQISIDEAFLDMTGTSSIFGPPKDAGTLLKQRVFEETGLTISVGAGASKFIAKMASAASKPNGLLVIPPGSEEEFLDTLPLKKIWGIGKKGLENLQFRGIHTTAELRSKSEEQLKKYFGEHSGSLYYSLARGKDPGLFSETPKSRSISNEITFENDISDREILRLSFLELAQQVFFRTLSHSLISATFQIKFRFSDFSTNSAQKTHGHYITSGKELFLLCWELFENKWDGQKPIRLIGVGLQQVENRSKPRQGELFDHEFKKRRQLEETILSLREKGSTIITASSLQKKQKNGS